MIKNNSLMLIKVHVMPLFCGSGDIVYLT